MFSADVVFKVFINVTVKRVATIIARKSAHGAANKIPTISKKIGRMIIKGIKQTISLIIEAITARIGLPTAWKKIEVIFIMQVKVTSIKKMRNVFSPNSQ